MNPTPEQIQKINHFSKVTIGSCEKIASAVSIPVICCGGAGNYNDISELLNNTQVSAATAGSLFVFHGKKRAVLINSLSHEERNKLIN